MSEDFKEAIVETTILRDIIGSSSYWSFNKIFIPSLTELGGDEYLTRGASWDYFLKDERRIATDASYWTRSPQRHSDNGNYYVSGTEYYRTYSNIKTVSVRPVLNISSDILVSGETNSQDVYEIMYSLDYRAGNNGTIEGLSKQTVAYGSSGTTVTAVPDEGYYFVSWSDGFETATRTDTKVANNKEVTAFFSINEYEVIFKDNDGKVLKTEEVGHGSDATAPAEDPTRMGYTFTGWDTDFTNVIEELTVTAEYDINEYTIDFDSTGGTEVDSITQNYGTTITAPSDPTKEGHTFAGWDPEVPSTMPADDITLTAQWVIIQYTVTFKDWNDDDIDTDTVDHGSNATAPADPARTGYTFDGWDTDFSSVTETLTVVAKYAITTYTVTFKDWDDDVLGTDTVEHGSSATAPSDPEKEGYTFTGWDADFTNIIEDLTVTAEYEINEYTVIFKDWNGDVIDTDEVEHGSDAEVPDDPEREGYTFIGWDVENTDVIGDLTITAEYEINEYIVTFKDWDESVLGTDTVEHGSGANASSDPERDGHSFIGWDVDFSNVTSDLTVTALYETEAEKVVESLFDGDGNVQEDVTQDDIDTAMALTAALGEDHLKYASLMALLEDAQDQFNAKHKDDLIFGDVEGTGDITVSDAILVLRHIVGLVTLDEDQISRANVSDGGEENLAVGDAILILRRIVGLINEFPVEE